MKIILAPDKFKGSLTCFEAAKAMEKGLQESGKKYEVYHFPMADGGDGFARVMQYYLQAETISCKALDPLGRPINGSYQWVEHTKTAIVELAVASGISLLKKEEQNPLITSTFGTGLIIQAAIQQGAKKIILGIGGSATNDAGTGIASALGYEFRDAFGQKIIPVGANLSQIKKITGPSSFPAIEWKICCDVINPFYGKEGAAFVYAPQKGATGEMVKQLDEGLRNFAAVLFTETGKDIATLPGAGAAGGVAGGLVALTNASLHAGIDMVIAASGIENELHNTALLIAGEGTLDNQSVQGKVVGAIASLAKKNNIPCIALCGRLELSGKEIRKAGLSAAYTIAPVTIPADESMRNASFYLQQKITEVITDNL